MQNLRVSNKEHYGMLWYFLEWSIAFRGKLHVARVLVVIYVLISFLRDRKKKRWRCLLEERIPLRTSSEVGTPVSSNYVWFLDIIL